ncbi:MAG: putative non-ribosomal peptide synthetase module [Rhodobacteraceae bacterium HLUCCA12]|nr:MAG: putative non-ribosomal peptide synthetase module [Rhodobacteraceae bacterium HLUCCA12]
MTAFSCVLVGNESLTMQCAKVLIQRGHAIRAVASRNTDVIDWADTAGIPVVAPGPGLEARLPPGFDWLFSIANLSVLPEAVVTMAEKGAVNFHDGPLPRYAGLNAPVWALINGEAQHGITWHMIEPAVDAGDIIEQVMFDIGPDDIAFSLNARCYASAIDSFPAVVSALESGNPPRRKQDLSQRSLCLRDDRPAGAGRLDFTMPAEQIARRVRALDHGGYWNPLTLPKIETDAGVYAVGQAAMATGTGAPGTVLSVDADGMVVACADGALRLTGLTCLGGLPVDPAEIATKGGVLPRPDMDALSAALARVAPGEGHWRRALSAFAPAALPDIVPAPADARAGIARRAIAGLTMERAGAILAAYAERIAGATGMAYSNAEIAATHQTAPRDLVHWVPLMPVGDKLAMFEGTIHATAEAARRFPGYPRDLIARDPALPPLDVPPLGLSETGEMIAGTALCLVTGSDGLFLMADTARVGEATLDLFAARMAHLAQADGEALIETLDLLSPPDKTLIESLNETARDHDRTMTISRLFEAQVARTPEAPALVFEDTTLSYAELNTRANRVASVLQAMGIGPDVPVALCTRRSPDMLIGALGILKAGGAYVPMDPAYPADRLDHFLNDSGAPVIVTQSALIDTLPPHRAELLVLDTDTRLNTAGTDNPDTGAAPENLAYLIYTSGSTGRPKGVMVEHRNVANFFAGMDDRIRHDPPGVWLAVTSLSFDISVLELFWTLARGFKLVLTSDEDRMMVSGGALPISDARMDFSLFYWGNDDGPGPRKYELLLEGAKFADSHDFSAVWLPERHFHAFGGPYPNPSVLGAAVAAVTRSIGVRSGSVVAPLHHPVRIAEEWAVIDNLTNGRVALGIASGWHPVDFILRPENAPPNNKTAMFETIDTVRRLWRGESVEFDRGGERVPVQSLPRPVSKEIPIWLTIAGNPDTWREAGEIGANVLTHLLGQSIDEVAEKIKIYHAALRKAGHDPADFTVTLMLHTYVARSRELARETARGPMKSYLLSAAGLVKQYAWSFPAFKRPKGAASPMDIDLSTLSQDEVDGILDYAFNRYFEDSGLFGTVEDCLARVEHLKAIGVSEIACLIDYGIKPEQVLEGLYPLSEVHRRANQPTHVADDDFSIAAQIVRHGVTHLQCTPSMARMLVANDEARAALARVGNLMIGGEALPGALAQDLAHITGAPVQNMYGPTETTIWSTTGQTRGGAGIAAIGTPIANTTLHVLDPAMCPVPLGAPGELWIGGEGVTRGYWQQPELSAERFVDSPFGSGRLYRTGDLVRLRVDGSIDFLGRADHQIKIRGHRIEPGEIETVLDSQPGITQSVVLAREDTPGDLRLVAYVTGPGAPNSEGLRHAVASRLPPHMVPAHVVALEAFPLTPNKKIDRKALPAPGTTPRVAEAPVANAEPAGETQAALTAIWRGVLGVDAVRPADSFFALGGHSLLAVQAHREIREKLALPGLSITDVFRFPVLADLARHIDTRLKPVSGAAPSASEPAAAPAAQGRQDAISRRRALRAERLKKIG